MVDDVDGDNFDHAGLGFLGGSRLACGHQDGRPIGYRPVPPGTPRWGSEWKQATQKWCLTRAASIAVSGSNYANRNNYLDLDPTYNDQLGRPLLRLTYNFVENDYKVMEYTLDVAAKIARAMNPTIMGPPRVRRGDYDIVPYQSTHTGGTIMGTDPKTSVVNRYLQSWDAHNLFIMGASTFSAAIGQQPDRAGRGAGSLVGGGDRPEVSSQEPRPLVDALSRARKASEDRVETPAIIPI